MPNDADFGDDLGPAARRRPSSIETVGGEWRGQFKHGGVNARRYRDASIHDLLQDHGLITQAQHEAAERLCGLWAASGIGHGSTALYSPLRPGKRLWDDGEPTAEDEWHTVLNALPMHLAVYAMTLARLEWRPANLPGTRDMLDWLVKEWGI